MQHELLFIVRMLRCCHKIKPIKIIRREGKIKFISIWFNLLISQGRRKSLPLTSMFNPRSPSVLKMYLGFHPFLATFWAFWADLPFRSSKNLEPKLVSMLLLSLFCFLGLFYGGTIPCGQTRAPGFPKLTFWCSRTNNKHRTNWWIKSLVRAAEKTDREMWHSHFPQVGQRGQTPSCVGILKCLREVLRGQGQCGEELGGPHPLFLYFSVWPLLPKPSMFFSAWWSGMHTVKNNAKEGFVGFSCLVLQLVLAKWEN